MMMTMMIMRITRMRTMMMTRIMVLTILVR